MNRPRQLIAVGMKIMALYLTTTAIAVNIGLIVGGILNLKPAAGMKPAPVSGFKAPTVPALKARSPHLCENTQ